MASHARPTAARLLFMLIVLSCSFAPAAFAQSRTPTPAELRRENEALRERVEQLEAELRTATDTIQQMREQMDELSSELESLRLELRRNPPAAGEGAQAASPEPQGPAFAELPEGDQLAAPEAMLAIMIESYEQELAGASYETDADYRRYMSLLSKWSRLVRRELRGQAEWVVEITGVVTDSDRRLVVSYRVIDPASRLPYGDREYELELPGGIATRRFRDNPDHDLWLIRGRVLAMPEINPDRETVGFFDIPPFIGSFAEFGFDFRVETFVRVADPEEIAEMRREREERERRQRERNDAQDEEVGPTDI